MSIGEFEISRVRRSKAEAQETYDKISRWYDLLEGIWEKKARDVGLQKLDVKEGFQILDATSMSLFGLSVEIVLARNG